MKYVGVMTDKRIDILLALYNAHGPIYAAKIVKIVDTDFAYGNSLLHLYIDKGLISVKRNGRTNFLELTIKGKLLASKLCELRSITDNLSYK